MTPTPTAGGTLTFDAVGGRTWDVVVIGAGPAGAMAARELASRGCEVLLVDRKLFPRSKVCGACLNGPALSVLESVGLGRLVDDLGGVSLESLDLRCGGRSTRFLLPAGAAVSRERFDAALVEAAVAAGADFLPEAKAVCEGNAGAHARVVRLTRRDGSTSTSTEARIVVVASGLGAAGLDGESAFKSVVSAQTRVGAGCVVDVDVPAEGYRGGIIFMNVGRGGYVGLVRVEDGRLNVAAAFDHALLRRCGSPAVAAAEILADAGAPAIASLAEASWQGTAGLTRSTRPLAAHRVFLIGDAAGYVEPFTGEGMAWALASGLAAAPLVGRGVGRWEPSLVDEWASIHRRLIGRRQDLCRGLAWLLRHPRTARAALGLAGRLSAVPRLLIRRVNRPHAFHPQPETSRL